MELSAWENQEIRRCSEFERSTAPAYQIALTRHSERRTLRHGATRESALALALPHAHIVVNQVVNKAS